MHWSVADRGISDIFSVVSSMTVVHHLTSRLSHSWSAEHCLSCISLKAQNLTGPSQKAAQLSNDTEVVRPCRLWPEMQARMHPSCPLVACTLTAVVRLQSRDRAGPIALKSTPGSHVILQPSGTPPQSMHTAHLEGSGHAADSAQAGSVPPNQAQADSTPLALAAASAAPPGQLTQASEVVQLGHALGAAAHVPVQPQQILRCSEPMMQSNAGSKQHHQKQAGSSRGRQGDHPKQEYISCSSGLQLHAAQNMCADAVGCVPDQMPYQQHSVLQQASRQPQPTALQGVTGLTSGSLPAHHHSAAPSAPVDVGHGGANVMRFHSCSAQHSPSQMSTVACTGATQYYTLPRNSTEMPASSLPGTQPPSEGPQDAGHAAAVHGQDVQALQLRSAQSPAAAESVHAAGHLPRAAWGEMAGPSSCQVSKDAVMLMFAQQWELSFAIAFSISARSVHGHSVH